MVIFRTGETVSTEEVYRFLHSIKGTSGTLQLGRTNADFSRAIK